MGHKRRAGNGKNADIKTYTDKRKIPEPTRLLLIAKSGGRCALCNKYLFRDPLTGTEGNYAQRAHIVGFSEGGPRGRDKLSGGIHDIDNLMLLCHGCHETVDKIEPEKYPAHRLRKKNDEHNRRIAWLTDIDPAKKTTVIKVVSRIKGEITAISNYQIAKAVDPLYPTQDMISADLNTIPGGGTGFLDVATHTIDKKLGAVFEEGTPLSLDLPVSVFAIAPLPVLIHLGRELSNKVEVAAYQRHRDTGDWTWKKNGPIAKFDSRPIRVGSKHGGVALVLALSGTVELSDLPAEVDDETTVYRLTLKNMTPNPGFLGRVESLQGFRAAYGELLAEIQQKHSANAPILLFPAVPAPVAVYCGFDLMSNSHPPIHIFDGAPGAYTLQYKVFNDNQR